MLSSADLPGKALMANMKQYNGEQGCSVCEDKGKTVGTGGLHRIWPYTTNMVLRTHKAVVESVRKVIQTGKPVCFLIFLTLFALQYFCMCICFRYFSLASYQLPK